MRRRSPVVLVVAAVTVLASAASWRPVHADDQEAALIDASPLPQNAQNVILFLADDLDWNDLPFFNPPKQWQVPDSPTLGRDAVAPGLAEALLTLPDLNRSAARMLAVPRTPENAASLARLGVLEVDGRDARVVPVDVDGDPGDANLNEGRATADTFSYVPQTNPLGAACASSSPTSLLIGCNPHTDILRGYGGLGRLAREGLVFPRFYSSSARCSPARAALMTGRDNDRGGLIDIGDPLDVDEVTIAEFLKQGCTNPASDRLCVCRGCGEGGRDLPVPCDCFLENPADCELAALDRYPCYTTGLIGKWHIGSRPKNALASWQRGFDEYIGFRGGRRGYFRTAKLDCSPATARYCLNAGPFKDRRCTSDAQCGSGGRCGLTDPAEHGLYVGAEARNPCHDDDADTATKNVDCCEAEGADKPGRYEYASKRYPTIDSAEVPWGKDGVTHLSCSDDGDTRATGCLYYTRRIRDQARDFILRHADAQPFFLVVAFNAPHTPHQAPRRTRRHFSSSDPAYVPTQPDKQYWAVIEELDAAIGGILDVLDREGVCDAHRTVACTAGGNECPAGDRCISFGKCSGSGWPCADDAQCPVASSCVHAGTTLADKTLVLFTSDNGHNNGPFGDPATRKGKSSVYEGGIRVGLLARAPDLGVEGRVPAGAVGSFVDVLPTVADAAGYASTLDAQGQLRLRVCARGPSAPCLTDADCPGADNRCILDRVVDGHSLLPTLTTGADAREASFSRFFKDTSTVITREGYFEDHGCGPFGLGQCAKRVCGLDERVPEDEGAPLVRRVRGSSCVPCTADDDCNGESPASCNTNADCIDEARCDHGSCKVMCEVLGKVCADDRTQGRCTDDDFLTCPLSEIAGLQHCHANEDCNRGQKCIDGARTACGSCASAAWKLRGTSELYDLTSNPEEDQKVFKHDDDPNGRLNCFQQVGPGQVLDPCFMAKTGSAEQKLCNVQSDLVRTLTRWSACVQTPSCSLAGCTDCEDDVCQDAPATCN
jgi:arylsulfatase A-like enzyme